MEDLRAWEVATTNDGVHTGCKFGDGVFEQAKVGSGMRLAVQPF